MNDEFTNQVQVVFWDRDDAAFTLQQAPELASWIEESGLQGPYLQWDASDDSGNTLMTDTWEIWDDSTQQWTADVVLIDHDAVTIDKYMVITEDGQDPWTDEGLAKLKAWVAEKIGE